MIQAEKIDGLCYLQMIESGTANLKAHAEEVNELNVFPIPDGDTGENMLLTMVGGVPHVSDAIESIGDAAEQVSEGMLLSARGNSGVILSQFFDGVAHGLGGLSEADTEHLGIAFRYGVKHAYASVMTPTEGTILTVIREATEYACNAETKTPSEFLRAFLAEAKKSLERTPELLPVLKKAGVVDSGAAGLIYIMEGMLSALMGEKIVLDTSVEKKSDDLDIDAFGEDSELTFGYCTELLLRLQNKKTDIPNFNCKVITDYLSTIGDSIVAVQNGSVVKIHVHTMSPQWVLDFCQKYGEFLKVKIENMSLQHNNTIAEQKKESPKKERKAYGVVAVASGEGLKQTFIDRGADYIVDGGQSMNPSAEDFLAAFDEVNADTIFVLPNNGNIVLTAIQAARLYEDSDVRVIESKTIGAGYAALSMLDTTSGDTDVIEKELNEATEGVITAEISHCIRNANIDGVEIHTDDYIGFAGKKLLATGQSRTATVFETLENIGFSKYDICLLFVGKDASMEEAERIEAYLTSKYRGKEIYLVNGEQDVYDYILVVQ